LFHGKIEELEARGRHEAIPNPQHIALAPSSRTINSALRIAILSHGMPRNFYWDNGEDYKKVRLKQ